MWDRKKTPPELFDILNFGERENMDLSNTVHNSDTSSKYLNHIPSHNEIITIIIQCK